MRSTHCLPQASFCFCVVITIGCLKTFAAASPETPDILVMELLLGLVFFGSGQVWALIPIAIGPDQGPVGGPDERYGALLFCSQCYMRVSFAPGASQSRPLQGQVPTRC